MQFENIPIGKIVPNPSNPRGIDIQSDDPKLNYLKDSISQFGVMVPIVVSKRPNGFLLIDGERRYWASMQLGLKSIPAYVIDQSGSLTDEDVLFRMFQIHHNREQWLPVQQCRALETVYRDSMRNSKIKSIQDPRAQIKAIAEKIVYVTGLEARLATNRVYFLLWPRAIKDRLYNHPEEKGYWYICEIEEKIIIPARINYPEYFDKVPVDEIRTALFEKLECHSVEKATEVRRVAPFFRSNMMKESDRKSVIRILSEMKQDREMTYAEAQEEFIKTFPNFREQDSISPRKLYNMMTALTLAMEQFDCSSIFRAIRKSKASKIELSTAAESVATSIQELLKNLEDSRR
jgi:ParB/RepB/Spo0J family partition protein